MTSLTCPFVPLCERDFVGPELEPDELDRLQEHLSGGCADCERIIEEQLSGSGEGEVAARQRDLEAQLSAAVGHAEEAMAPGQMAVLARVRDAVGGEDLARQRRMRRRALRAVFYVVNLAAVVLLAVAYMGTAVAAKYAQREGQVLATRTELKALVTALHRYVEETGSVPADERALLEALHRPRQDREDEAAYFPFVEERMEDGRYLDDFGRPYRYELRGDRVLLYSVGPDGRDDEGRRDDLVERIQFAR